MKTVLITGASGGIGSRASLLFAKNGYNVFIQYNKNEKAALELCEKIKSEGVGAYACRADITSEEDIRRMVSLCEYKFGSLDVLINNAGISEFAVLENITSEMWDRMMNVNVKGKFLLTRASLPLLR